MGTIKHDIIPTCAAVACRTPVQSVILCVFDEINRENILFLRYVRVLQSYLIQNRWGSRYDLAFREIWPQRHIFCLTYLEFDENYVE
jgi:hypothetical protein